LITFSGSEDQSGVLDYNQITPVGLHSINDSNQHLQEAQYKQREAEYWSVSGFLILFSAKISKRNYIICQCTFEVE
jgi:hypothetical protein